MWRKNRTATYEEVIQWYTETASKSTTFKLLNYGTTDCGKPLQLFVISNTGDFKPATLHLSGKMIILINNGIHAGEPDGIDACMELTSQIKEGKFKLPDDIILAIIPAYNIDGALNRNCCTRANQQGPEEYGFRANSRYLDLNRDFIKCDSKNALSFSQLYTEWNPDIFIDTHVSNGADYQYTMTLIASQHNKLHPAIGSVMQQLLVPSLYREMEKKGEAMTPYVNVWGTTPDKGYEGFDDSPRYASGYSALFNTFPFVTETHMLKPFPRRVEATVTFLKTMIEVSSTMKGELLTARENARQAIAVQKEFSVQWKIDTTEADTLQFKGYEAVYPISNVTGLPQLHYDRSKPYTKAIPYYNTFHPTITIKKPSAYIIPQAWSEVADKMRANGVKMQKLSKDSLLAVTYYHIDDYKTVNKPYEGHYLHSDVKVSTVSKSQQFRKGDLLIYTNQPSNRYIIETLEPQAPDSWFAWGFFDAVLQYKEGFSDYVWEPQAEEILKQNPDLKKEFEEKKKKEPEFAANAYAMLNWVYRHSQWSEPNAFLYPVGRIE